MENKIAIYMRSSLEQDEDKRNKNNPDESDTIANQRKYLYRNAMLKGFDKSQIIEYVDDGHTGTNFKRPAFQQMIEDIEAGLIKTVLVKDFSRLGRDYIGVGEYVEQFFPRYGVRIISVNDNWDSDEHIGETLELDASFRTMIYEMYSRDLSVKRKTANQARNNNGVFIGAYVPFGYKKIEGDTHSIIVDETCEGVVKRIFKLFNSGEKISNIAKILTDEGVPTPALAKNDSHSYDKIIIDRGVWDPSSVGRILKNEMYTGTLILNRWVTREFKSDTCVENDPAEWMRFPNNHEAIISREEYDKAQKRLAKKKRGQQYAAKRFYPIYCGHCGGKLSITTRNEQTFICTHGEKIPADQCGQIEIRKDKLEEILLKAVNSQAKILLEQVKGSKVTGKQIRSMEKQVEALSEEQQAFHDRRMDLYKEYKAGQMDRDSFLTKKTAVLKQEEECMAEIEVLKERIREQKNDLRVLQEGTDKFREYSLMDIYDCDVINQLISKVEFYNDGHIKITWNYESEFGAPETDAEEGCTKVSAEDEPSYPVAIYTSDLFLMPQNDNRTQVEGELIDYAEKTLKIDADHIACFEDKKEDYGLFFREGYMRFIDMGRTGKAGILLIRSFKDLYLSNRQMNDLMFWILPKIPCRLIAVEDGFDSDTASEAEYREMYEKYKGVRNGDLTRYRAEERKAGLREAKQVIYCSRLFGYVTKEDGCYAVPELLDIVKRIFQLSKENHNLKQAVKWLNDSGIPTTKAFFIDQGYNDTEERNPKWNKEKAWGVIKQEGYVHYCRHYEKCRELGRHCERIPIIDQETFDEVNEYCRYRNR